MRRFFYTTLNNKPLNDYQILDTIELTADIHHHWCRVLRAKVAEHACLFDGFGGAYEVEMVEIGKKKSVVRLIRFDKTDNTPEIFTEIGLVMSRGDRMDYAIQKATEMGVTIIQLLTSQHGEIRLKPTHIEKKVNHWQQIAISACEQCGLNRPPIILAPLSITDWFKQPLTDRLQKNSNISESIKPIIINDFYQNISFSDDISLVLSVPKNNSPTTPNQLSSFIKQLKYRNSNHTNNTSKNKPLCRLLIGSEGGLSLEEITQAEAENFHPWQIGNRILRTETAPVVALATLQAMLLA